MSQCPGCSRTEAAYSPKLSRPQPGGPPTSTMQVFLQQSGAILFGRKLQIDALPSLGSAALRRYLVLQERLGTSGNGPLSSEVSVLPDTTTGRCANALGASSHPGNRQNKCESDREKAASRTCSSVQKWTELIAGCFSCRDQSNAECERIDFLLAFPSRGLQTSSH